MWSYLFNYNSPVLIINLKLENKSFRVFLIRNIRNINLLRNASEHSKQFSWNFFARGGAAHSDWKNNSDEMYSCPRDWWGAIDGPLQIPVYHSTIVMKVLRGALYWALLMPRDASLSDSQFKDFKFGCTMEKKVLYAN